MKLFDAHCHLQDPRIFCNVDRIIAEAAEAGVGKIHCCGISEGDWVQVLVISEHSDSVIPSFGLHPWFVADRTPEWREALLTYLRQVPCGIGEIGLDHNKPHQDVQEEIFLWQLDLAKELKRPVSIHCCNAWGRLVELLEEAGGHETGFILHSYSGSAELIERLAPLGAYFSFSCTLMSPNSKRGPETAQAVPIDRLLTETDAPYLAPYKADGTREELSYPRDTRRVLARLSELRETDEEKLAEQIWTNAARLFQFEP